MSLVSVNSRLVECRACPRLVEWRERVASEKRASFRDDDYWGRPVPGFGDPNADVVVVGLAPAAHGANRTGRMFTGDRSGDFLFSSLHRTGFANQPTSDSVDDGLTLSGIYITSMVKCAPPANKPTPEEQRACSPWLEAELDALPTPRVIVALGGLAYTRVVAVATARGWAVPSPVPRFGHGVEVGATTGPILVCCYHPSQQNTFTGRLTPDMIDAVFRRAALLRSDHNPADQPPDMPDSRTFT
jgi:uracil-DNA glycosylase